MPQIQGPGNSYCKYFALGLVSAAGLKEDGRVVTITKEEADKLVAIAEEATDKMLEAGAHCAVLLWSREVEKDWLMEWSRHGSPLEIHDDRERSKPVLW